MSERNRSGIVWIQRIAGAWPIPLQVVHKRLRSLADAYSCLSGTIGSTGAARRAGSQPASAAAAVASTSAATRNTHGSAGVKSNRMVRARPVTRSAPPAPIAMPGKTYPGDLAHREPRDCPPRGAECHAHAQFVSPPRHLKSQNTEHAQTGDKQCEQAERAARRRHDALRHQRPVDQRRVRERRARRPRSRKSCPSW